MTTRAEVVVHKGTKGGRGYRYQTVGGLTQAVHKLIVERVLGKPLPVGVEIHHVDGDKENNTNSNLVVCPSAAYHKLLHQRMRALLACGNADWRMCSICHKWDSVVNLYVGRLARHRACHARAESERKVHHDNKS